MYTEIKKDNRSSVLTSTIIAVNYVAPPFLFTARKSYWSALWDTTLESGGRSP